MDNKALINKIDRLEIYLGELYSGLSKYPTLDLKNSLYEIISKVIAIKDVIVSNSNLFDIRDVKRLDEVYKILSNRFKPINKKTMKAGHHLAIICFKISNLIIDVCIELEKYPNIFLYSEIHEYLNTLNQYFDLCGKYINDSFCINDIYLK